MIRCIVADEFPIVRNGIKNSIEKEFKGALVSEANSSNGVLQLLDNENYDIVITEILQPNRFGIEFIQEIHLKYPNLPILIFSFHSENLYAIRLVKAGIMGYLTKKDELNELINAIKTLLKGKKYFTDLLTELMADHLSGKNKNIFHESLSDREFEVLVQIALGNKYTDIAKLLFLSPNTINTYRSRIIEKMGFKSNTDIVRYAFQHNLV